MFLSMGLDRNGVADRLNGPKWIKRTVMVAALAALPACSSAAKKADERFEFVRAHGTNRELCEEGKRRKQVYTDAGKYDARVWLEANTYCLSTQLGEGDVPADRNSAAYRQYRQIESDVSNEQLAAANAAVAALPSSVGQRESDTEPDLTGDTDGLDEDRRIIREHEEDVARAAREEARITASPAVQENMRFAREQLAVENAAAANVNSAKPPEH